MIHLHKWHLPKIKLNKVIKKEGFDTKYLSINIATINQPELLKKCLESIYKTIPTDFPLSEINVWENGSTMAIQGIVEQAIEDAGQHPSFVVHFFRHRDNVGFGVAHNEMVKMSAGRYVCMLNDDMEIYEQDWANKMIDNLSSTILQVGGHNLSVCNRLDNNGHGYCAPPHMTDYCDGAFIMMNTEWARALGPWDTGIFKIAYCEDPDLSLRIRALGYKIRIMPVEHIHYRAKTSSNIKEFDLDGIATLNRIKLLKRWDWYMSKRDFCVRIAIVRSAAAGDVLMATSVLAKVRELAPEAIIDVYTGIPRIFENNTKLDRLYHIKEFQENRNKYHMAVLLDNSYERDTKELSYRAYYKVAGLEDEEILWPELYFTDAEFEAANKIIDEHKKVYGNGPIAIFHTGMTNWPGRNMEIEKFEAVSQYLQNKGWSIIEVGGKETKKMSIKSTQLQGLDISPRISMVIISMGNLFVGIDSFPWNVAQTCKIPSVVTFGCIDPRTRILDTKLTMAVRSKTKECLGCHHEFRGPVHESRCMRINDPARVVASCMEDISVEQLVEAIDKVLKENTKMSETAKIREKVAEYIKEDSYGIDIGCGPDKLYKTSLGFDKYKTIAVDFVGDARDLPFEDNEFDYVFSSHCLEDFIDKENVLKEWCRTIKPGGKIGLYLPHKNYYKGCNLDHYELFDSSYIKPILEKSGFTIDLDYLDIGDDRYSFLVIATKNA